VSFVEAAHSIGMGGGGVERVKLYPMGRGHHLIGTQTLPT